MICCVLQSNAWIDISKQLERVQRKILVFASYILKTSCPWHDYTLSKLINLAGRDTLRVLGPLKGCWMVKLNLLHLSHYFVLRYLIILPEQLLFFYVSHGTTNYLVNEILKWLTPKWTQILNSKCKRLVF